VHHRKLNKNEKQRWDKTYSEEYNGLANLPTLITIAQQEYEQVDKMYKDPPHPP